MFRGILFAAFLLITTSLAAQDFIKPAAGPPKWLKTNLLTAEKRKALAKDEKLAASVLPGHRGFLKAIAEGRAEGKWEEAFPYWEFIIDTGTYEVTLDFTDAAWSNTLKVGKETIEGKGIELNFGEINNRGAAKTLSFKLDEPSIIRFEGWTDEPNVGVHRSHIYKTSNSSILKLSIEDGADSDFNDLIVHVAPK